MKLLVYGAGVIGSLYAAKLKEAGNDVSILARGKRFDEIKSNGIVLENVVKGERTVTRVDVVECLKPEDAYDLILVVMPRHQISSIKPALSANKNSSAILFMLNNASGYDEWIQTIGYERFIAGFPGAAGWREGGVVYYRIIPGRMQPTTLGEHNGDTTDRLKKIAGLFQGAGFATEINANMDAWLKYHVAWASPLLNALYMAGGDGPVLASQSNIVRLAIKAVRESFAVLKALGFPVTPSSLRARWEVLPEPLMVIFLQQLLKTKLFKDLAGGHAQVAYPEFKVLSEEFQVLARSADMQTPAIDKLHAHLVRLSA